MEELEEIQIIQEMEALVVVVALSITPVVVAVATKVVAVAIISPFQIRTLVVVQTMVRAGIPTTMETMSRAIRASTATGSSASLGCTRAKRRMRVS